VEQLQSEKIGSLAKALNEFQTKVKPAIKDSDNPFFKSKYAKFENIVEVITDALPETGLSHVQTTVWSDNKQFLRTVLMHDSGEWICGYYVINPVKDDPQGYGSAMTYAKRQALAAIYGIVAEEDDDGEASMGRFKTAKERKELYAKIESEILECIEESQLKAAWSTRKSDLLRLKADDEQFFINLERLKDKRKQEISNNIDSDLNDELPEEMM